MNKALFKLGDKFIINALIPFDIPKNCIIDKRPYELKDVVCEIYIIDDTSCENKVIYKLRFDNGYFSIYENQLLNYKQI